MSFASLVQATVALFIIIDPLGSMPIFLALTQGQTLQERRQVFAKATVVAYALLVIFAFGGRAILGIFGITVSDFKIAGGIMLLVIALQIINEAHAAGTSETSSGVVPFAVPLMAGPGAITTTIVLIETYNIKITMAAILVNFVVSFLIFRYVTVLFKFLGKTGSDVIAKIMGMLLAAIAIQFIRQGIQEIFHI
jgi:multiple antibiotic resistance protein